MTKRQKVILSLSGLLVIIMVGIFSWGLLSGKLKGWADVFQAQQTCPTSLNRPAFPGAEGFGAQTAGGHHDDQGNCGKVYIVTTVEDYNPEWPYYEKVIPGSLRWAIDAKGPRIVVFRVSGTIELKDTLKIINSYLTIAGQTAPGGGITIKGAKITIGAHDVVIRHLRIRTGNDNRSAIWSDILRSISFGSTAYNVIIDHCSISWATDENVSSWSSAHDITLSWNIISEGLYYGGHSDGPGHSCGALIANGSNRFTFHHNLFAHNGGRNPQVGTADEINYPGYEEFDIRNNLVYNFGYGASSVAYTTNLNFVGNYILKGINPRGYWVQGLDVDMGRVTPRTRVYVKGNIGPGRTDDSMDEWEITTGDYNGNMANRIAQALEPFPAPAVTTHTADEAYNLVLEKTGAIYPLRDSMDVRHVNDVKNKTGEYVDSPYDKGGWPELIQGAAPLDSDNDGMPDDWENTKGLNPNDPSDNVGDRDGDGYLNVEEYFNSLVAGDTPQPPNYPPYYWKIDFLRREHQAAKGYLFELPIKAGDPEGKPVTIAVQDLPSGASFDGTNFKWVPTAAEIGKYQIIFIASDGEKTSQQIVNITVTEKPAEYFTDWDPRSIQRTGKTYYVATTGSDSNPGTEAQPFAHIGTANGVIKPGDTVIVKGGVYTVDGNSHANFARPGAKDNPILFTAASGEEVIIQAPDPNKYSWTNGFNIVVGGVGYLWFNGFTFRDFKTNAIATYAYAHHIWFTSCKIYNTGGIAIRIIGSHDIVIDNCLIDGAGQGIIAPEKDSYITIKDCEIRNVADGIRYNGWYEPKNNLYFPSDWLLVNNCNIHDNTGYAIDSDAENVYVLNTTLQNNALGLNLTGKNVYIEDIPITIKEGDLIKPVGSSKIYLIYAKQKHHIPNPSIFLHTGFKNSQVKTISLAQANLIPTGKSLTRLWRSIGGTSLYHLSYGERYRILNPRVLAKLGYTTKQISNLPRTLVNQKPENMPLYKLRKPTTSPKVYLIFKNYKRWVVSYQAFANLGFKMSEVKTILPRSFKPYPTRTPNLKQLLRSPKTGKIYYIQNQIKHWVTTTRKISQLGYTRSQIITVPPGLLDLFKTGAKW